MDAVGLTDDLHPFVADNPYYRQLFYEELPGSLRSLADDPSPANQVRASRHLQPRHRGQPGPHRLLRLAEGVHDARHPARHAGVDQARSATTSVGTWRGARSPAAVTSPPTTRTGTSSPTRMGELMPLALGMIQWVDQQFDEQPFGLDNQEFIAYAADRGAAPPRRDRVRARAPRRGDRPRLLPRRPRRPLRGRGRGGHVGGRATRVRGTHSSDTSGVRGPHASENDHEGTPRSRTGGTPDAVRTMRSERSPAHRARRRTCRGRRRWARSAVRSRARGAA